MTYQIVVPIIADMPHIEENLKSINDWEHLLIIDNSENSFCKKFEGMGAQIKYFPNNIGVSRAWNLGIAEGKDYTFFVSSSVKFHKGFKEVIEHLEAKIQENNYNLLKHNIETPDELFISNNIEWGLFTQLGWHCNGISKMTVDKIGIFDTNFYPAYYEDFDYCRRLKLAGIHNDTNAVPIVEIDAESIMTSACTKLGNLHVDFQKLADYYSEKWGGIDGTESTDKPFGCPLLRYFPYHSIDELKEKYGLI